MIGNKVFDSVCSVRRRRFAFNHLKRIGIFTNASIPSVVLYLWSLRSRRFLNS